jgi:hypothetical protein
MDNRLPVSRAGISQIDGAMTRSTQGNAITRIFAGTGMDWDA